MLSGRIRRWLRWPRRRKAWIPATKQEYDQLLTVALAGIGDSEYRANIGQHCWYLMDRTWYRRTSAVNARKLWNGYRYAGAVIPVVAAGAGGTLVAQVHGTAGTVIGTAAIVGGLAGSAINAVRPAEEYGVDLAKAAQFEELYWNVFNYSMTELRLDSFETIAHTLAGFAETMKKTAMVSGGSTATGS